MADFYDESGFTAPQYGLPGKHDRILLQSGMDAVWKYILIGLGSGSALAGTIFLIANAGTLTSL